MPRSIIHNVPTATTCPYCRKRVEAEESHHHAGMHTTCELQYRADRLEMTVERLERELNAMKRSIPSEAFEAA